MGPEATSCGQRVRSAGQRYHWVVRSFSAQANYTVAMQIGKVAMVLPTMVFGHFKKGKFGAEYHKIGLVIALPLHHAVREVMIPVAIQLSYPTPLEG